MATGLDALSPARRTQYEALLPDIERSLRSAASARGGYYSGAASDAEVKAKTDLLAKLAAEDAAQQGTEANNTINRDATERMHAEDIKANKRGQLLGVLGSGVGAAATLGGLKYMNPSGGSNVIQMGGRIFEKGPKGAWVDVTPGAAGGSPVVGGRAPIDMVASPGGGNLFEPSSLNTGGMGGEMITVPGAASAPAVAAPAAAAPTSMWKNAIEPGALGAGALGGGLGYLASKGLGANGTNAAIGSAAGGAGGYLGGLALASKFGWSNPWAAGLGALAGATGGGLLGNLFK